MQHPKDQSCDCGLCAEYKLKENVICETRYTFVMFNRYPYLPGHVMVVPKRPVCKLADLNLEERIEIMEETTKMQEVLLNALGTAMNVTSTNIGINTGPNSGASIPHHLHVHIVPRRANDLNFMHTCTLTFGGEKEQRDSGLFKELRENARRYILNFVHKK